MHLNPCELELLSLPQSLPKGVREGHFWFGIVHMGRGAPGQEVDGGVRQPSLGTLKGGSTVITYTHHRLMGGF